MKTTLLLALAALPTLGLAQTDSPAGSAPKPAPAPKLTKAQQTSAELQKTVDQLTQSNHDLLDLLKKQQAVLEDMQFDRRLQSRQIASLEERLEDTLYQNTQLQKQVAKLEAEASLPHTAAPDPAVASAPDSTNNAPNLPPPQPAVPQSNLPPAPVEEPVPPGTLAWHRLFTLKGTDNLKSDLFQVQGRTWRVQWHNLDKPGQAYVNTSALFINAFPKDDTIPQKVCAKLGAGGDATELVGPGTYYLKVEASGGSWELAVEDFR